jgi:hypothetical protein
MVREFTGHMDLDSHPSKIAPGDYGEAYNITKFGEQTGVVNNVTGNKIVDFVLPSGVNTCIGSYEDKVKGRLFYFIHNSTGFHTIAYYNKAAGTVTTVLQSKTDTGGVDIMKFLVTQTVKDVYIIHRDEGDLLFFNDAYHRPSAFNIDTIRTQLPAQEHMIRLAKRPPVYAAPFISYATDTSIVVNNHKKKLYQFIYRWEYEDGYLSTWSPISKVKLPIDAYTIDTETNPTNNNVVNVTVYGGPTGFKKIHIAVRESLGQTWGDFFLAETIDKDDYGLVDNATYVYRFLNDGAPTALDQTEIDLPFDLLPDRANSMSFVNGNIAVFGGITEGREVLSRSQVNVQINASLKDTSPNSAVVGTPKITTVTGVSGNKYYLQLNIGPEVSAGDTFNVSFTVPVFSGTDFDISVSHVASSGDTQSDIAQALVAKINTAIGGNNAAANYISPQTCNVVNGQQKPNAYAFTNIVVSTTAVILKSGGRSTYKWNTKYRLGIVYFDEYGKWPGVVSYSSNQNDLNDFAVTTPNFQVNNNPLITSYRQPQIPVINVSMSHMPPSWAVSYQWVRTPNLSVLSFLQYVTCKVQNDTNYFYFCIENLDKYRLDNTGYVPSYDFSSGDRLRVLAGVDNAVPEQYNLSTYGQDFEILGVVTRPLSTADGAPTGRFLKVAKGTSAAAFSDKQLIEVYRPALRSAETEQVFYSFGEVYPIYVQNGVRYHKGQLQNQTATLPATFLFEEGDVYYKFRNFYTDTLLADNLFTLGVMDANYSENWNSAVNSNGNGFVIDPSAKRLDNPGLMRFSKALQQGTSINGLNRFFPENFVEAIRNYGEIEKLINRDNILLVFQRLKIGRCQVNQRLISSPDESETLVVSDRLLSEVYYYKYESGCGDVPEAIAIGNNGIYGVDNVRGIIWRLTQEGIEPISIIRKVHNFTQIESKARGGNYKIYGCFDAGTNKYHLVFSATSQRAATSIVFDERSNGFDTKSYLIPEWIDSINGLLCAWKNGALYTHNGDQYNRFFGVDYPSSITAVFNDMALEKKTFDTVSLNADSPWENPEIKTSIPGQISNIVLAEYKTEEGEHYAAIRRDVNSSGGKIEGSPMKGKWITIVFKKAAATAFSFLHTAQIGFADSPKNK